jgi:hypothetical protein
MNKHVSDRPGTVTIILITWEAAIERMEVPGQPAQKVLDNLSQPVAGHSAA